MTLRRPSRMPEVETRICARRSRQHHRLASFAGTDQLIVREVRDEATARVVICCDVSETMQWPRRTGAYRRAAAAEQGGGGGARSALKSAHLHLRMGDRVEPLAQGIAGPRAKPSTGASRQASAVRLSRQPLRSMASRRAASPRRPAFAERTRRPVRAGAARRGVSGRRRIEGRLFRGLSRGIGRRRSHGCTSSVRSNGHRLATKHSTSYFDEGVGRREYQGQVLRRQGGQYAEQLALGRSRRGKACGTRRRSLCDAK